MTGASVERREADFSGSEKYCLRPRKSSRRRKARSRFDDEGSDDARRNSTKHRPPALSKYRRKTANARERSRMREINLAFETLRRAVPSHVPQFSFHGDGTNEKLTKITTLRLAMRYIAGLVELLRRSEAASSDMRECIDSYVDYYPSIFRHGDHQDDANASSNSTGSCFNSATQSLTDSGSDGESFHSAATVENFLEQSVRNLVPESDLQVPDNYLLINPK